MSPKLIVTSVTPFGQDGPYRDYAASEIYFVVGGHFLPVGQEIIRVESLDHFCQKCQIFFGGFKGFDFSVSVNGDVIPRRNVVFFAVKQRRNVGVRLHENHQNFFVFKLFPVQIRFRQMRR